MSAYEERTRRMPAYEERTRRMPAYEERTRRMPSVPLTYVCVCERMIIRWHAYAASIRCSMTALLLLNYVFSRYLNSHLNKL